MMVRFVLILALSIPSAVLIVGQASPLAGLNDPVALLAKRIERGEVTLDYNSSGTPSRKP
jgi:hypothetical protein